MRLQRRRAFAAPFVMVIACNQPRAPRAPVEDPAEPPVPRSPGVTAEPPRDAGVADAPDPYTGMSIEERCRRDPQLHCNPPRPPSPPPRPIPTCGAGLTCNPPAAVRARVIGAHADGPNMVIVISRGSREGLSAAWHGCLARDPDATSCAQGGELQIFRVNRDVTFARVHATRDQVFKVPFVRFTPP